MNTNRTIRRLVTVSASVALLATAPGLMGSAAANDTPSPSVAAADGHTTLSPALVTAIQDARNAFKVSARAALDVYRTAKNAVHAAMAADPNLLALRAAKDTSEAAKAAYEVAKAPYAAQEDAARTTLKASIDAAKAVYVTAVKAAFATYAPTVTVPAILLEVSGRHHGYAFGHLNVKPVKAHSGGHVTFNHAASLHMVGSQR